MGLPIPKFSVRNHRGISFAECVSLPSVMVIAGPNGCGKTTVLDYLYKQYGGTVIYQGPHRAFRRQQVQYNQLLQSDISISDLLSQTSIGSSFGIRVVDGARDAWQLDESGNYLKHAMSQVEVKRKEAIASRYDAEGEIRPKSVPDPWKPLREMTSNLLPHLEFSQVNTQERNNVRVLWTSHKKGTSVDLDDLSSGEKSIIQLMYPVIEVEINTILDSIAPGRSRSAEKKCVLIDEVELHLHPNLQVKVLDYLRKIAIERSLQVIITTHSPTIVESAEAEELYLLKPVEMVGKGDNQLSRVASDEERLKVLRQLFGSASNLTAMQPILVVESQNDSPDRRFAVDRKIFRALHPAFDRLTLLGAGGKSQCIALVSALNKVLVEVSPFMRAFALVDQDVSENSPEHVIQLPVSMIENFFVDPTVILKACESVAEQTGLKNAEQVENALNEILAEMTSEEIERRVVGLLGAKTFRIAQPIGNISEQLAQAHITLDSWAGPENIAKNLALAKQVVESANTQNRRREVFHGKNIVERLYAKYLHKTGLAKHIFSFYAARAAKERKSVREFFDRLGKTLGVWQQALDSDVTVGIVLAKK